MKPPFESPATSPKVRLLRDARPPIFQDADSAQLTSPVPVAWDQLRAIRDRKAMEIAKGMRRPWRLPSGKHTKSYGKSSFFMGKSTINDNFQFLC